jgi:phage baseplate assembly protein W
MKGLAIGNNSAFIAEDKEYLKYRLERLLYVSEGEALGYPDWGSKINEIFHEPEDETSADEIINEIVFLIQERDPDVEIEDIYVDILGLDSGANGIIIKMNVYSPDAEEVQLIEFFKINEV